MGNRGPSRTAPDGAARQSERSRESDQTQAAMRALFDSALDAILVATDHREYVDANPAACELLGASREELLGTRLEDYIPEDQQEGARKAWDEFLELGQMEGEISLRRVDGEMIVAEFRARAGFLPGRHLSVLRDVTERKRQEEALRESGEQNRLIVESALDYAIFTTDADGRIATWPPGAAAVFGWTAEEILGRPDAVLFVPEDRVNGQPEKERETARREGVAPDVRWHLRKDGSRVFVEGTNRHLADAGGRTRGFLKIGQDATGRRELESERQRLRARELTARAEAAERERISRELHDRVAHSMAVALQSLELHSALAETAPHRATEKLELARESTRHALEQTRSLAAELRRLQGEELRGGLPAAFEELVETSVPDGIGVDLSFFGVEGSEIPGPVALQAYLVIREALTNAVRHSRCERVSVRLELRDRELVGEVEDDGAGFVSEGTDSALGVGLQSMRERAEILGGSLLVAPRPDGGTRVELRVPLEGWPSP